MGATGRSNFYIQGDSAGSQSFNPSWVPPAGLILGAFSQVHFLCWFQSLMGATGRSNVWVDCDDKCIVDGFNPSWRVLVNIKLLTFSA